MPSDARIILLPEQEQLLLSIKSDHLRKQIVRRLESLGVFPQSGSIDAFVPPDPHGSECRITYVAHYGIRYRYEPTTNVVTIDSITDERYNSTKRFL